MELKGVEELEIAEARLNASSATPNSVLNGRDLILRAARKACSQEGDDLPNQTGQVRSGDLVAPGSTHTSTDAKRSRAPAPISGMLADKLVQEGLNVHERPIVQYTPRSSVPRIARQVQCGPARLTIMDVSNCAYPVYCMFTCRCELRCSCWQGVANRLAGQLLAQLLQQAGIDVSVEGVRQPEAASARKHAVTAALAQELSIFKKASGKQVKHLHAFSQAQRVKRAPHAPRC